MDTQAALPLRAEREDNHPASPWWVRDNKGAILASYCAERDAKLFSAAPDLLAELAWFISDLENPAADQAATDAWLVRARAAIAKAEGRAP